LPTKDKAHTAEPVGAGRGTEGRAPAVWAVLCRTTSGLKPSAFTGVKKGLHNSGGVLGVAAEVAWAAKKRKISQSTFSMSQPRAA